METAPLRILLVEDDPDLSDILERNLSARGNKVAVANSAETKKWVAANPNTIGYIESNLLDNTLRVVTVTER